MNLIQVSNSSLNVPKMAKESETRLLRNQNRPTSSLQSSSGRASQGAISIPSYVEPMQKGENGPDHRARGHDEPEDPPHGQTRQTRLDRELDCLDAALVA